MKSFMAVVAVFFVALLTGCATEPEQRIILIDRATTGGQAVTGEGPYLGRSFRGTHAESSTVGVGDDRLTVDNYTEDNVINEVVLHRVEHSCQTGNHGADGKCLRRFVPELLAMQGRCNNDTSAPNCKKNPGKLAGDWDRLGKELEALGEKEIGDAVHLKLK